MRLLFIYSFLTYTSDLLYAYTWWCRKRIKTKKRCDQKRLISKNTKKKDTQPANREPEVNVIETYIDRRRGLRLFEWRYERKENNRKTFAHPTKSLCKCPVKLLFHEDVGFRDLWHSDEFNSFRLNNSRARHSYR